MTDKQNDSAVNILIIENDPDQASHLDDRLSGLGYGIRTLNRLDDAGLEAALDDQVDLVLMDIALEETKNGQPGGDYWYSETRVPVIFLAWPHQVPLIERPDRVHCCGRIMKPVAFPELKAAIRMGLHLRQVDRERLAAEAELRRQRGQIDQMIEERTGELRAVNEALRKEIAERQAAEEARKKLTQAVEQSPTSVVITDLEGAIEYVNPKFTEVTGYTYNEAIGENPRILKSGEHSTEHYADLWRTIKAGRIWRGEILNRKKNGEMYWEFASISSVKNDQGEVTHFVAVKEDITDRKRTEQELKLAKEAAEKANKAKSDFLASMSHEIRTPMNAIIGMTDLTLQSCLESELRDNMITIKDSANHLLSIINDILDLSKIEAGRVELENTDFDLFEDLQTALRTVEIPAVNKGLDLKLNIDPDTPRYLKGDPVRLRQIMVNLLGNAMKFTPEGGIYITVRPARLGGRVRLHFSIRDTGIGIPEDKLEEIFLAFSQAEGSTTRRFGGTGLGLAICKRLVEMMGGRIGVQSEYGKGSEFFFTSDFEISDGGHQRHKTPVPEDRRPAHWITLNVLLAEDNPVNAKVAQKFLTRLGYTVQTASDGREAIDILSRDWFDLVLMDVEMPGMDGMEATRRIRAGEAGKSKKRIPIIAITAHVLPEFRDQAEAAGMNDFVTKPVDFYELNTIIGRTVPDRCCAIHESQPKAEDHHPSPVINRQDALRRLGGDADLLDELTNMFLRDLPGKLKEMKKSVGLSDFRVTEHLAHAIKGAAAAVGAEAVQDAAYRLERTSRERLEDAVQVSYQELKRELDGILAFFNR